MEKDEMKTLHDDVMEQVSGGTWVENKELVALYNKYNPDDPLTLNWGMELNTIQL